MSRWRPTRARQERRCGRCPASAGWLCILALAVLPATGLAQTVQGTLLESTTREPISAALVHLEQVDSQVVESTLTDAAGRFQLHRTLPGRFRLVVRHIGHETVTTEHFDLGIGVTETLTLEAGLSPIRVRGVTANEDRRCRTLDEDGARVVAAFWDEARKALEAAQWTGDQEGLTYEVEHFARDLDPESMEVVDQTTRTRTGPGAVPFRSLPAEDLAAGGYVQGDHSAGRDYYAPDAAVLLSSLFTNTHCFRLGEVADSVTTIEFEPIEDGDVSDIRGSFRLNARTLKLERLDFHYTELDLGVSTDALGGWVEFEELTTGAWIVRDWVIRMPQIYAYQLRSRRIHFDLIGFREVGGTVQSVVDESGRDLRSPTRGS